MIERLLLLEWVEGMALTILWLVFAVLLTRTVFTQHRVFCCHFDVMGWRRRIHAVVAAYSNCPFSGSPGMYVP